MHNFVSKSNKEKGKSATHIARQGKRKKIDALTRMNGLKLYTDRLSEFFMLCEIGYSAEGHDTSPFYIYYRVLARAVRDAVGVNNPAIIFDGVRREAEVAPVVRGALPFFNTKL